MRPIPEGYELHAGEDLTIVVRRGELATIREIGMHDRFTVEDMLAAGARSGRGRVVVVPPPEDAPGRPLVLKQVLRGGLLGRLASRRFPGPARILEELRLVDRARRLGVPAPEIAYLAWTTGRPCELFLATDQVPGSRNLEEILAAEPPGPRRRESLRAAALAVREMHDAGLVHRDLNCGNLMVAEAEGYPEGFVIDLGGSRLGQRARLGARAANLARLLRSVEKTARSRRPAGIRERVRFLWDYCAGDQRLARTLARRVRRRAAWIPVHRALWRLGLR